MSTITIQIGDVAYQGRLPHMRHRFRLHAAWLWALGYRDDDPVDLETGYVVPSASTDTELVVSVIYAAMGLCWDDEPLGAPGYLQVRREYLADGGHEGDVLMEYGMVIEDAMQDHGAEIWAAGHTLLDAIRDSIPTEPEVEEALDPTEAPVEICTGTT